MTVTAGSTVDGLKPCSTMDPAVYLSQGKFHRSIRCNRTQARVTFALIGDWNGDRVDGQRGDEQDEHNVILYVLPSGCSRYMGILLDGIANVKAARIVAIDRPGAGGTPICPATDRMRIATEQTLSVLEHLQVKHLDLLTHSAGWFYALNLITCAPEYFAPLPNRATRFVFSSPFVPTHISGSVLAVLPKNVVSLTPLAASALGSAAKALSWSAGFIPSSWQGSEEKDTPEGRRKKQEAREKSRKKKPDARFHPPYDTHTDLGLDAWKTANKRNAAEEIIIPRHPRTGRTIKNGDALLFDYFQIEDCVKGVVEDFLFCLGKVEGMNNEGLDRWTAQKLDQTANVLDGFAQQEARTVPSAEMIVLWGEDDFMIPKKGKEYLMQMLKRTYAGKTSTSCQEWVLADGGHDTALTSKEVLDEVLSFLCPAAQSINASK